jgi:hypothetical protein
LWISKAVAKDFILENENYHREYTTLGELNKKSAENGKTDNLILYALTKSKITIQAGDH